MVAVVSRSPGLPVVLEIGVHLALDSEPEGPEWP